MLQARRVGRLAVLMSLLAAPAAFAQGPAPSTPGSTSNADLIKRGQYLATVGDCQSCHTMKGGAPMAGGQQLVTPYGTISSPNITPDKETGIGSWSDDDFYKTFHQGLAKDGSYLYPVMPFDSYTKVTRDDALAIKAYLFSLKPVHAPRPPSHMAFPFNVRTSVLAWRTLFFKEGTFQPDPKQSDEVNRGAYLVQGLGHCGTCHTPRNALSGSINSEALGGGEITGQGWFAPNITSDVKEGIGAWSTDEITTYLKTGVLAGKAIVAGPMAEVVHVSLANISAADRHAIAAYLKSTPSQALYKSDQTDGSTANAASGEAAYLTNCGFCHQKDGSGISGAIPPLAGNAVVLAQGPQDVIRTVLNGMPASGTYAPMPGLVRALPPGDIAQIVNYVRIAWGNKAPANATPEMVGELTKTTKTMLSGTASCAPVGPAPVAAAIDKSAAAPMLQQINAGNMLERINAILPKIHSADASIPQADLVNGLTAAYCPIVMGKTDLPPITRVQELQRFSMLVFTGITQRDIPATSKP